MNKNYNLLVNQSTVDQIANPKLLKISGRQIKSSQSIEMLDPLLRISRENLGV
jgi:hypothetical protein